MAWTWLRECGHAHAMLMGVGLLVSLAGHAWQGMPAGMMGHGVGHGSVTGVCAIASQSVSELPTTGSRLLVGMMLATCHPASEAGTPGREWA